ncbi:MAG: hypothetical protein MJE68_00770, partial [Proteobacteria bacterium]|nr:hypothetical protein [Pseudomonadota bacterium]
STGAADAMMHSFANIYNADLYRAKNGIGKRASGLKYSHVVRDNWTWLNVLPAKIIQVNLCCFIL